LLAALALACAAADQPGAKVEPPPPNQRELWVPSNQLAPILEKYPNAVVLSREQYSTLLRDANLDQTAQPSAPRRVALTAARYQARLAGKVVQVTGELTANVLSDEWAQVPLDFEGASVGAVQIDGEAAFQPGIVVGKGSNATPAALLVRGKGERRVTVEFSIPVFIDGGLSRLNCRLPVAASSVFQLDLPAGQRVDSPQPVRITNAAERTSIAAGLSPAHPALSLTWRGHGAGAQALEPLVSANGIYTIDAERVHVEYGFLIETQLGNLPENFQFDLPENAKVLQVTGQEVAKWDAGGGKLKVTLQPGERASTNVWLVLEFPSLANAPSATLPLFVPRIDGLARMQGVLSVVGDAGVMVKSVSTDATIQPVDRAIEASPHFVASYQFHAIPTAPRVSVEKVQTRFSADLDTLVAFKPEAIFIERTLTLHQERGETFQVSLSLPAGEEVISVGNADGSEPDWRMEAGKLRIRWSELAAGQAPVFKIRTRSEPQNWTQLGPDGLTYALGDARIDGADKITGYIALKAAESFRLEAAPSETLERRDGRTTPVQGDYAWFRRQDFTLSVKIAKRPGEVLASLTGYVLPLEGVLDLHARINLEFLHSGTRSVRVQVPEKLARSFYFDGPQIAERNLNGDIWTIVFQKELTGSYGLAVTAQVPVETAGPPGAAGAGPGAAAAESQFQAAVPLIVPLDVARTSGVWAVEANTETEIQFEAKGMNELDSLLAPRLPDYQPRHRVIGVFAWLGQDYTLKLSGVRHTPATVLTSVVDSLELDTVVSTSGVERNQATFQLRTAGAQYLDVQLPAKSRLLSVTVDGNVVKPVGDHAEQVRVQLAARRDASATSTVSVLYEIPKGEWSGAGQYAARGPKLAKEIPILRSTWRLYLPDGFEYTGLDSNLRAPAPERERPLVLSPLTAYQEWRAQRVAAIIASSGTSDETTALPPSQPVEPVPAEPPMQREMARRSDYEVTGSEAMASGDRAIKARNYKEASASYKRAADTIPDSGSARVMHHTAVVKFCDASVKLAEQYITEGRFGDAEATVRIVLDARYDPTFKRAIILLARLEQPDYYNKAIGPQFRANVEKVKQWFIEAQGFYDTGRFDLAKKRCEQILSIDKYNIAAREMEERIDRKISDYGIAAYNQTRADMIRQIDVAWQRPIRKFNAAIEIIDENSKRSPAQTEWINRKLDSIIIPKLEFRGATIREAIEFLRKKSAELDVDSPVGERGVNFVLKLEGGNAGATPSLVSPADTQITVTLTNIPLREALKDVTSLANLKYKVDSYAVVIVPLTESTDVMVTKEWSIDHDALLEAMSITGGRNGVNQLESLSGAADRDTVKQWLMSNGVVFNGAASAIYIAPAGRQKMSLSSTGGGTTTASLPAVGRLIARNTQDQLDLMDRILSAGGSGSSTSSGANGAFPQHGISGLLPMKLDLPKVGRVIVLEGLAAAEHVEFQYNDWWNRARRLWLWFVGGGLLGLFLAGSRPWRRTCWVLLLLTFYPYCVSMTAIPVCNALLAGWLISVVLQRLVVRMVFAPRGKEVLA